MVEILQQKAKEVTELNVPPTSHKMTVQQVQVARRNMFDTIDIKSLKMIYSTSWNAMSMKVKV